MRHLSSLVSLLTFFFASVAHADSSCVAFDVSWNLLAFGFNGKDYNAGTQDKWAATSTAQDITTSGRPPFNGPNTACYLSEYTNAIYVLGADNANPSAIFIYDATAKSWSTQTVNTQGFDPSSFSAILDHDTNVFYALSKGEMYSLDMGLLKAADSTALSWVDVQNLSFGSDYQLVMAIAQNHIHFLNVPGVAAGSAMIFVIHYSYLQPQPQPYGNFPATHGQATSFFEDSGVQQQFAFIPDDGSATYVINVETNTTQTLPGPTIKDSLATYFASTDSLVQLAPSGKVSYIQYSNSSTGGTWNTVTALPLAVSSSPSSNGGVLGSSSNVTTSHGAVSNSTSSRSNAAVSTQLGAVLGWSIWGAAILLGLSALI